MLATLAPIPITGVALDVQLPPNAAGHATSARFANESPYVLQVNTGAGTAHYLQAWTTDVFAIDGQKSPHIVPMPNSFGTLSNAQLLVTLALDGEVIPGTYPVSTSRADIGSGQTVVSSLTSPVFAADPDTQLAQFTPPSWAHSLVLHMSLAFSYQTADILITDISGVALYNGTGLKQATRPIYIPVDPAAFSGSGPLFVRWVVHGGAGNRGSILQIVASPLTLATAIYQNDGDTVRVSGSSGGSIASQPSPSLLVAPISNGAGTPVLVSGVVGKIINLFDYNVSHDTPAAGTASQFQDTTGVAFAYFGAGTSVPHTGTFDGLPLVVGRGLQLFIPGGQTCRGFILYTQT